MHTKKLSDQLFSLAQKINPSFSAPSSWSLLSDQAERELLSDITLKALTAEHTNSFFDKGHYEKTLGQKKSFTAKRSRLVTDFIGNVYVERFPSNSSNGALPKTDQSHIIKAADDICREGYCVWPEQLSKDYINSILLALSHLEFTNRVTGEKLLGEEISRSKDKLTGSWWISEIDKLGAEAALQELAFDPTIIAVVQEALGTIPIHVQTNCWWSFPHRKEKDKAVSKSENRNAQRFHQDQEFITFIKVFVYLSDVEMGNGPHVYVARSIDDLERVEHLDSASNRMLDKEVAEIFKDKEFAFITGPAGQIAFVNTRGYHKGAPLKKGFRLILQFEYASSMYFNPVKPFSASGLTENLLALRNNFPRAFKNYRAPDVSREGKPLVLAKGAGRKRLLEGIRRFFLR